MNFRGSRRLTDARVDFVQGPQVERTHDPLLGISCRIKFRAMNSCPYGPYLDKFTMIHPDTALKLLRTLKTFNPEPRLNLLRTFWILQLPRALLNTPIHL